MEQSGIIKKTDGTYAEVEIKRATACETCSASHACLSCKKKAVVRCVNRAGGEPGDSVKLETPSSNVLWYAFCVFVLPLICAFAAYVVSSRFLTMNRSLFAALAGFVAAFVIVFFTVERPARKRDAIVITEIINKAKN